MKRVHFTLIAVILALATYPLVMAQGDDGYNEWLVPPIDSQTKNLPAGTVGSPGSELLFILDTGVDADSLFGGEDDFESDGVSELGSITEPNFQNYISVTNTNPTESVTVHFRYFNSNCSDIIDFLVVLTCNDTMLIDPFDFVIPGTTVNVEERFFGSTTGGVGINAIPASEFGDGRFLLFVVAAGDPIDATAAETHTAMTADDNIADWWFSRELVVEKWGSDSSGWFPDCAQTDVDHVGAETGTGNDNLHVFNASAISFDYLVGIMTTAVPTGLLVGDLPDTANDLAYGVAAWTRPSVDLCESVGDSDISYWGAADGDQIQAPTHAVLAGSEDIDTGDGTDITNYYYLRNEAHGGDTWPLLATSDVDGDGEDEVVGALSLGGALNWTLFPIEGTVSGVLPSQQMVNFLSAVDDYNGSGNPIGAFTDRAYGVDAADTFYYPTVFNNDEGTFTPETPVCPADDGLVSPGDPPVPCTDAASIEFMVRCVNAWSFTGDPIDFVSTGDVTDGDPVTAGATCSGLFGNPTEYPFQDSDAYTLVTNLGSFSVEDLLALGGAELEAFLDEPVVVGGPELGPGRVRLNRRVTILTEPAAYDGSRPTFITLGQNITRFEGFGMSIWLPVSATDFTDVD